MWTFQCNLKQYCVTSTSVQHTYNWYFISNIYKELKADYDLWLQRSYLFCYIYNQFTLSLTTWWWSVLDLFRHLRCSASDDQRLTHSLHFRRWHKENRSFPWILFRFSESWLKWMMMVRSAILGPSKSIDLALLYPQNNMRHTCGPNWGPFQCDF